MSISKLRTELGVANPDDFYARLIELHEGLTSEQSHKINAKVILMLANHVGDTDVLIRGAGICQQSRGKGTGLKFVPGHAT